MESLNSRKKAGGEERLQDWIRKALRVTLKLLLLTLVVFAGYRVYDHLLEDPIFRLKAVEIKGCEKIPENHLLDLVQMEGRPNLFTIPLTGISKRLESHPWIEGVAVRKVFPNKISIQVRERRPVAILQLEDLYYIDARGVVFAPVGDRDGYDYPFLTGLTRQALEKEPDLTKGLIARALDLLKTLEQWKPSPFQEISEVHMERGSGIECFTKNEGIGVRLGWDRFGEKLNRLSLIWSDLQRRGIAPVSVDCTDPGRVVVRRSL